MVKILCRDTTTAEADTIPGVADDLIAQFAEDDAALVLATRQRSAELPPELRDLFAQAIEAEPTDVILVRGDAADDGPLGPTPSDWGAGAATPAARREEVVLMLLASLVGDVFAWETQQSGRIVP